MTIAQKIGFGFFGATMVSTAIAATAMTSHGDATRGERVFARCAGCHSLAAGENRFTGPTLNGVVGRDIASSSGFTYSAQLRAFANDEGSWSPARLDRFIANPRGTVPGTRMATGAVTDAEQRADLIAYLRTQ